MVVGLTKESRVGCVQRTTTFCGAFHAPYTKSTDRFPYGWTCRQRHPLGLFLVSILLLFPSAACGLAAESTLRAEDAVVCLVDGEPIRAGEVARLFSTFTRGKQITAEGKPIFQAQTLEEIVNRRLVLAYAKRSGTAPTDDEIGAAVSRFEAALVDKGRSLDEYCKTQSMTPSDLRRQITWDLLWDKYRSRYVTKQRAGAYFEAHRRELDGTRLLVSHILLRPSSKDARSVEELIERARKIRGEIVAGKLSFADAARRHSAGPSAKEGGRLGWIGRHGPMDASFSRAAFLLEAGQVSEPVRSPFGVHLIRCNEIKPGSKRLGDVWEEVAECVSRELLEKLARHQQQYTRVEFRGNWPHFKPGTHELAAP